MGTKGKNLFFFFSEEGHGAIKLFDIMHTPCLLGWVKGQNCADKYNLIELIDLIGFGYELSDTQDGL